MPEGTGVGGVVGLAVGASVGEPVGLAVGEFVGDWVGDFDGEVVGEIDGDPVGEEVGASVGEVVRELANNNFDQPRSAETHTEPITGSAHRWQAWRHHVTPGVAGIWVIQDRANQVPYHGPYQEPIK